VNLEGRVIVKKRGSSTGAGDLEFNKEDADIRCQSALRVYLNVYDSAPAIASQFKVASVLGDQFIVDPQSSLISCYTKLWLASASASERVLESGAGDLEVAGSENLILKSSSKNATTTFVITSKARNWVC
jgi:hypothetical protein